MGKKRFARVMRIARSIGEAANYSFEVELVDDGGLHAVADAPSNTVRVTEGLVKALTDDALAWVIAHEVAHLEGDHRQVKEQESVEFAKQMIERSCETVAELKEDGMGFIGRTLVRGFTLAAGVGATFLVARSVSRDLESQADLRAVEIALDAGFDPEAGMEALVKLHSGHPSSYGFLETLLHTHPDPVGRARAVLKEAENLKDEEW